MDQKHRNRRPARSGLAFESLESRLLLSADLAPVADALASEPSLVPAEHRALEAFDPAPSISMRIEAHELVFVDGSIADRDRLLADFVRATGADRAVEVVVLDPDGDGVAQIGAALASRKGLTAVHVLSHARQGAIDLGSTTLDTATLAGRADAIAAWAAAFAADGDLLLFGCDVAGTLRGESFVDELARLTGADVAASDDATGDPGLGGDWALEYATGAIEAALAPLAQAAWGGLLTTEVLDWDDPAVDWPAAAIGSNNFAAGGANVTITVTDPAGQLNNGSPDDDVLNDQGGLGATEQGLYVSSNGFLPGESSTITIDFAHAGGVSNVSFTIFDIDRGGGPNFIDEIQASFTASGAVTLAIANGPSNIVLGGDTVQGTAGAPSNGANSGDANATFTFTGSGITHVTLNYRNVGGATGQSITLHDISFDPTPTAGDRAVAMNEDTAYTFTAGDFGFADAGGDTLQAVWITQLETAGSLLLNGVDVVLNQVVSIADINANLLTFAPVADANGAPYANLRFQVGDGASFSVADYQLRIDLGAVNDAPTLAIGANQTVAEGAAAQTVVGFATAAPGGGADEAGQTFAYTVTNDNNALFAVQPSIAGNGTLTYTLAANALGTANVSVSVTDSGGTLNGGIDTSAASAFTITATPVADTPSVTNAATLEDAQTIAGLVISRNPADGAEVTHFRITGIAGGTVFLSDGTTAIANGTFITIAAGAAGLKFTPTLNAVAGGSFDVQASTAANVAGLGGGVITASIAVTAVNDAPTLAVGANQTVAEDAAAQTVVGFATAAPGGGADEAGQTFSYTVANDNNAIFAVQPSIAANGTLAYTLAANAIGTANVTVSVTDSGGTLSGGIDTTGPLTFSIIATPVADTPSVTNAATLEDTQTTAGLVVSRNPADGAEATHFRITGIAGGALFLNDGTTIVANGDFITAMQGAAGLKFTPGLDAVAAGSFDVQASTAANVAGLGGGVVTATIAVSPVNDEPSFTIGPNQTLAEDAAAQTIAGFAVALPGGGADEAAQTFTYTVTNANNALFTVQPAVAANGTLTYTLAANASGAATVTLFVTDSGGALNGGDETAPAQTFTITVTPVADAPTLTVNPATGNEDTAIALAVTIALVDADGSETLAVTVSSVPVGATLSDGVNSFTATAGSQTTAITGWNLAQLRVTPPTHSDVDFTLAIAATATETANGATATSNANLLVTVDAVADAPTINLAPAAGNEDTAIALTLGAVLVDADGSESLALALSGIPVGATLLDGVNSFTATAGNQAVNLAGWNLAALTVTPPANADADFTLTVTAIATEGANGSTAASVAGLLVDVLPVNDAPTVAAPATIAVVEDVASPLLGISFGDVDAGAGPVTATFGVAQGTLSATAGSGVAVGGTATALTLTGTLADVNAFLAGAGLRYTTALDTAAPVALTTSLNDLGNTGAGGAAASPNANVTLNVIPVNDAPVLGNVTLTVDAGGTVVLTSANLSATDVDDPLAGLVFFIAGLENGRFELAGNPGGAVLAFTQGQVTAGQVKFVQTDALRAPSYLVFVTDGASTVGPGIVALTFRPLFEPGGGAANKARDDGVLPTVSFASGSVDTSLGGLVDPFAIRFNRQPVVPTDGGSAAIAEAEIVAPAAGARQTLAKPDNMWELRSRGSFETRLVSAEMDKLPTAIPPLDFGVGAQRPHEEPRGLALALDAVRTAGLVVSVGAVWWASRAAGLISSLLAITPTWRHLDPLPVLGRDHDETAGGWDEPVGDEAAKEEASASEMFDGGAKKPASV